MSFYIDINEIIIARQISNFSKKQFTIIGNKFFYYLTERMPEKLDRNYLQMLSKMELQLLLQLKIIKQFHQLFSSTIISKLNQVQL